MLFFAYPGTNSELQEKGCKQKITMPFLSNLKLITIKLDRNTYIIKKGELNKHDKIGQFFFVVSGIDRRE